MTSADDDVATTGAGERVAPDLDGTAAAPAAARRVRWRLVLTAVLVVVLLAVAATAGIGYYFSGELLRATHTTTYPVSVTAVDGDQVMLSRDPDTEKGVLLGLVWSDGAATLGPSVRVAGDHVVRTVTEVVRGTLRAGVRAAIYYDVFDTDPKVGRGLDFADVQIPGEYGDMPAWLVPPAPNPASRKSGAVPPAGEDLSGTWVIAMHGRDGTRHEALRALPAIAGVGCPSLVITYRNDEGAPASPDGFYHLGDTEWRDLLAAIAYAREHGATGVVLFGWSMGGGAALTAMRRMAPEDLAFVRGIVLDSPTISWDAVIDFQGEQRNLPGFLRWSAKRFSEWRGDFSLDDLEHERYAPDLAVPVLLFVDEAERHVRTDQSHAFAEARPDLVTLVVTDGGGHVASWNVDPKAYEQALTDFLGRVR